MSSSSEPFYTPTSIVKITDKSSEDPETQLHNTTTTSSTSFGASHFWSDLSQEHTDELMRKLQSIAEPKSTEPEGSHDEMGSIGDKSGSEEGYTYRRRNYISVSSSYS
jgi:hypothetical protein